MTARSPELLSYANRTFGVAEVHFTAQGRDVFACDDDPDGDLDLPASTYADSTLHYIGQVLGC